MTLSYLSQLEEDPNNPNTDYVCGNKNTGSTYRWTLCTSTDAGATWPVKATVGPAGSYGTYCECMDIAPSNASKIFMGGTHNYKVRLLKSTNAGGSWKDETNNLSGFHSQYDSIWSIWVSPNDENNIVLGTSKGVFHSANGARDWTQTLVSDLTRDFVYYPEIKALYAATDSQGVLCSEDDGLTWQTLNSGLGAMNIDCLDIDRKNGYLFAGTIGGSAWRLNVGAASLVSDVNQISEATGGKATFTLDATIDNAGRKYILLGGISGATPGTPLPGGMVTLPVNFDLLTNFIFGLINTPVFSNFLGVLNQNGQATAAWDTIQPLPAGTAGLCVNFAYALNGPWDYVSNFVIIDIVP